MELLAALASRSSAPRLIAPGPTAEHLAAILAAAGTAPDHGRLKPWRLTVLDGVAKEQFASAAAESRRARFPGISEEQLAADREKILRSPTIVVVGCAVTSDNPKVPEVEQVAAVAAATQNLFLAAHDLGYGVMWKTGPAAYDDTVKAVVGLRAQDHIIGIMHLGTRPV
jgi:nitroreductase